MTANHGDLKLLGVDVSQHVGNEFRSADDIEGGDTEEAAWVELSVLLQNLGGNGDGAVDRVGDDAHQRLGAELGDPCG